MVSNQERVGVLWDSYLLQAVLTTLVLIVDIYIIFYVLSESYIGFVINNVFFIHKYLFCYLQYWYVDYYYTSFMLDII